MKHCVALVWHWLDGTCGHNWLPGYVPCKTDAECVDEDPCSFDVCTEAGICDHQFSEEPDAACVAFLSNTSGVETCNDCIDNDGDGLVDYEDPDCCAVPAHLGVKRVRLQVDRKKVLHDRIELSSSYASSAPGDFDPLTEGASLQISDANGPVFCAAVPANHWKKTKRGLTFVDKSGTLARGLSDGTFVVKKNGSVDFRAQGRRAQLRTTDGKNLRITVGVGNACSQAGMSLHPKKTGLVFP